MTTKATTNKFSPEVRERAVRMVLEHVGEYPSRWPTRSGPVFNKRQTWSPPQQAVQRTRRAAMPVEAFAGD